MIVKNDNGPLEVQTIDLNAQKTMPLFSFREEAEIYMRFEMKGSWWVRKTSSRELASLLLGSYSCVEKVALDPLPEICGEGMTPLVSVSRKDFMRTLAQELLDGREMKGQLDDPSTFVRADKEATITACLVGRCAGGRYLLLNAAINGAGHTFGYKSFANDATNLRLLALITFGEGLHNNHHARPASPKLSAFQGEYDPAWPIIRLLAVLRL